MWCFNSNLQYCSIFIFSIQNILFDLSLAMTNLWGRLQYIAVFIKPREYWHLHGKSLVCSLSSSLDLAKTSIRDKRCCKEYSHPRLYHELCSCIGTAICNAIFVHCKILTMLFICSSNILLHWTHEFNLGVPFYIENDHFIFLWHWTIDNQIVFICLVQMELYKNWTWIYLENLKHSTRNQSLVWTLKFQTKSFTLWVE